LHVKKSAISPCTLDEILSATAMKILDIFHFKEIVWIIKNGIFNEI